MAGWMIPAAIAASAIFGGSASRSAARTQAAAADRAAELQRQQFERQVELQEPFRQSGLAAQNRLLTLLGIGPQTAQGGLDGTGGSLIGTPIGAAGDATSPEFGKYAKDFGMEQFQADPGYGFRMSEGMKALERSAAARGGLMGGATGKALQRFGQELGSQEYQNAFNRYQAERSARLNPLQSLAGVAQSATNVLGTAGQNYATGAGEALGAGAQARASGYMGMANAITGGLGQYMNYQQGQAQNSLLQQALDRNRGYGMGYTSEEGFANTPSYLVR